MKDETKENLFAVIIVLLLTIGIGWWIYHQLYAPAPQEEAHATIPIGASPMLGSENASKTVVIFSDFECPFCGDFGRDTFPGVKAQYIETGKVRFVFKQFPLATHGHANDAALASLCAQDQGRFWEYHDVLYAHQENLEVKDLERYAADLKMDAAAFNSCLESAQHQAEVNIDKQLGTKSGVTGTPTFFFDGRKVVGALNAAEFAAQLQK